MATTTLCSNLLRLSAFPDFKAGSHTSISKCTLCAIPGRQVVKACERNVLIARIASPPACPRRKSTCRASSGSDDVLKDEVAGEADELIGEASISTSAAASEADEKVVSEELRSSGAVVFKRSSAQSHFEFATTLEKLDLAKLSSELSRESANRMGLQVEGDGAQAETPVEVLIDVEKDGRNLRLEGIANTAITVKCNTCGEAVAERVFAEFELLLTDAPVLEPVQKSVGVVLGKNVYPSEGPDEEDAGLDLDLDDKMYFPKDVKRLDISEYIRSTIHLKIPLLVSCRQNCKGICIGCGVNQNFDVCKCKRTQERRGGPLGNLKEEIEKLERMRKMS